FALRSTLSVLTRIDSHTTICGGQDMAPLPAADQRHPWLRYQVKGYTEGIIHSYEQRLETIWSRPVNRVHVLDFKGLTPEMRQDLAVRMSDTEMGLDVADTLCFQLGGDGSDRLIPDKGDLRDYWIEISSDRDFLARTGEAPEKVTSVDTLYLLTWSEGLLTSQHLISAVSLFRHDEREDMQGQLPLIDLHELGRLNIYLRFGDTWAWVAPGPESQQVAAAGAHKAGEAGPAVDEGAQERIERIEEEMHDLRHDVVGLRGVVESFTIEQSKVFTWMIACMPHSHGRKRPYLSGIR
ncbi:hypothetical protein Tco_0265150, partial [Tanacetum coccineum]